MSRYIEMPGPVTINVELLPKSSFMINVELCQNLHTLINNDNTQLASYDAGWVSCLTKDTKANPPDLYSKL
jgi:hypothetical protein